MNETLPIKAPGNPVDISLHSAAIPSTSGFMVACSFDVWHDAVLVTVMSGPQVPVNGEHGGSCGNEM